MVYFSEIDITTSFLLENGTSSVFDELPVMGFMHGPEKR